MTPSRPRTTALRLEALPARDVPAVVTVGGTLYIEGTDFADDVRVEHDPGGRTVRVYLTSHTDQGPVERKYQFSDGNINHLTFIGRGGDDRFVNRWAAPGNIKATGGDG